MKQWLAWPTALIVSLVALSGCSASAQQPAPAPTVQPAVPAATAVTAVDVYQAIGDINGVTKTGTDMHCDPSLATVSLKSFSGSEWNGTVFEVKSHYPAQGLSDGATIVIHGTPVVIRSGIIHYYDWWLGKGDDGKAKTFTHHVDDAAFNVPASASGNKTLQLLSSNFKDAWTYDWSNGLKSIDLCVVHPGLAN
jgi:hypothetical protein